MNMKQILLLCGLLTGMGAIEANGEYYSNEERAVEATDRREAIEMRNAFMSCSPTVTNMPGDVVHVQTRTAGFNEQNVRCYVDETYGAYLILDYNEPTRFSTYNGGLQVKCDFDLSNKKILLLELPNEDVVELTSKHRTK